MNRALREQQQSMNTVREIEAEIDKEKEKPSERQDKELIFSMERQIASLRAAKEALSREFKDLQTKKSGMYKDLKATREQRIQKLENNKSTMAGLIEKILRDPDFFDEQGKYIEKMRMAMENEMERLADYHQYEDGTVDQPLLTPDTVK
jgi:DNA repair exonuclease SbcCD ATPase subunit